MSILRNMNDNFCDDKPTETFFKAKVPNISQFCHLSIYIDTSQFLVFYRPND